MKILKATLGAVSDFLFPPVCKVCEGRLSEGGICEGCWEDMLNNLLLEPKSFYGFRVYSLFRYDGKVKEAIERMKYGGMRVLAELFASSLAEYLRPESPDVVVPIPLHPARTRERGFSQTDTIAEAISRELGIPVRKVLYRKRYTKPQALLTAEERTKNVLNAFGCRFTLNGERAILVDDVITTGSTFYYAASTLISAGAGRVVGATISRGS